MKLRIFKKIRSFCLFFTVPLAFSVCFMPKYCHAMDNSSHAMDNSNSEIKKFDKNSEFEKMKKTVKSNKNVQKNISDDFKKTNKSIINMVKVFANELNDNEAKKGLLCFLNFVDNTFDKDDMFQRFAENEIRGNVNHVIEKKPNVSAPATNKKSVEENIKKEDEKINNNYIPENSLTFSIPATNDKNVKENAKKEDEKINLNQILENSSTFSIPATNDKNIIKGKKKSKNKKRGKNEIRKNELENNESGNKLENNEPGNESENNGPDKEECIPQ